MASHRVCIVLLQNAGISGKAIPVEDLDIADFQAVMDINVTAAVMVRLSFSAGPKASLPFPSISAGF